jgi:hypothetical protein
MKLQLLSAPFPPPTTVQAGSDLDDASDHFPDGSGGEDKEYFDRPGTSRPALCAYNAMTADLISPDDVKSMDTPTTDFLCDQRANTCGIDFSYFSLEDARTNRCFLEVSPDQPPRMPASYTAPSEGRVVQFDDDFRSVRYRFPESILRVPSLKQKLRYSVGRHHVQNLRLMERFYHGNQIFFAYDVIIGSNCEVNSQNSFDFLIDLPEFSEDLRTRMLSCPDETKVSACNVACTCRTSPTFSVETIIPLTVFCIVNFLRQRTRLCYIKSWHVIYKRVTRSILLTGI